jgi:LacI family transcriptional regulator, gluconate utilization system Gnt-I transcriptional repressor
MASKRSATVQRVRARHAARRGKVAAPVVPPTLKDVAARVGVSINTVSRSLRAPQTVRPELRRRIEAVLDEINYVPNRLAGGLAGAHTGVVGVIVTSLYYSEFAAIIEAMQVELASAGLHVMIGNSRYDPDEELRLVRAMLSWRPAAIAIVGTDHHPRAREILANSGKPVIEIWDCADRVIDSGVGMDHRAVGAMQAEHLIDQGCRRLAFVGALRPHDQRAQKRLQGAQEAVRKRRVRAMLVATDEAGGHPDLGERLMQRALASEPAIDGVVCNSDVIAFGAVRALMRAGKRIPEDIALIGFGDNVASTCVTPPVSTIAPPRVDIGQRAARLILARIDGSPAEKLVLTPNLIARASSQRANRR